MHWIEQKLERNSESSRLKHFFKYAVITLGLWALFLVPAGIHRPYVLRQITLRMWIGLICGFVWISAAPYLVYRYIKLTKEFLNTCRELNLQTGSTVQEFSNTFGKNRFFKKLAWVWILIVEGTLILDAFQPNYLMRLGMYGYRDVFFYMFLVCVTYILYLTALGLHGIILKNQYINHIVKSSAPISFDYFSTDGNGGVDSIFSYSMKVTRIFFSGVLCIPILLDYILFTNYLLISILLYTAVVIYSLVLFFSFTWPLFKLNRYISAQKEFYIGQLKVQYIDSLNRINSHHETDSRTAKEYLHILFLENKIQFVKNINTMNISALRVLEISSITVFPMLGLFINLSDIKDLIQLILN